MFLPYSLSTILKISKNAGKLLKPHIPILVTALLEAISGLEPQVMNYLSLQTSSNVEIQNRVCSILCVAMMYVPPLNGFLNMLLESLMEFHKTLQTHSYIQDKYLL